MRTINFIPLIVVFSIRLLFAWQESEPDSALIKELERELQNPQSNQQNSRQTPKQTSPTTNPNISFIGDFQGVYDPQAQKRVDAYLNEVETAVYSAIDPYARADFFFSFHKEEGSEDFHFGLEEGYITTLTLPWQLQLKAGKFRSSFGKTNLVHPHALYYIDNPQVIENYFGESLSDEGISLSWLIPNPLDFYQELTIQATRGPGENNSFIHPENDKYLLLGHLKNFWDLSDNSTLELGISGASGPNDSLLTTTLAGLNVTYKWKPVRYNRYESFEFQSEFLWSDRAITANKNINTWGMYAHAIYQIAQRWFVTTRFDYTNQPFDKNWIDRALSGVIGWQASEFQKIELQYKHSTSNRADTGNQIMLRSVFVIGSHGAHQY